MKQPKRAFTIDNSATAFDAQTIDSTGVFFGNELIRLDPIIQEPMSDFPFARDIDIVPLDVADETTAFDRVMYGAVGGANPAAKSFIASKTTEIGSVSVDMERTSAKTFLWAQSIRKTIIELAQAQRLGRPLDNQFFNALQLKLNLDSQNMVYTGDTDGGVKGLINSTLVTTDTLANNGAGTSKLWINKTDDEILADFNSLLNAAWAATGYTIVPQRCGLAPAKFSYLLGRKITGGNMSLMKFLSENTLANAMNGKPLEIVPMRELTNAGAGGAIDRMVVYTKRQDVVRWPKSPLLSTPVQFVGLHQVAVYYCRFGTVEFIKPEAVRYADGM